VGAVDITKKRIFFSKKTFAIDRMIFFGSSRRASYAFGQNKAQQKTKTNTAILHPVSFSYMPKKIQPPKLPDKRVAKSLPPFNSSVPPRSKTPGQPSGMKRSDNLLLEHTIKKTERLYNHDHLEHLVDAAAQSLNTTMSIFAQGSKEKVLLCALCVLRACVSLVAGKGVGLLFFFFFFEDVLVVVCVCVCGWMDGFALTWLVGGSGENR
jgi:hypothetical protein